MKCGDATFNIMKKKKCLSSSSLFIFITLLVRGLLEGGPLLGLYMAAGY